MPATTAQKLKIKEGYSLLTIGAPANFRIELGELPDGVSLSDKAKTFNQIHWFVQNKAQREKEQEKVLSLLEEGITLWTYFPKGSSTIQTDLTRDRGWGDLTTNSKLQWLSLVSFNETWSAFALRLKTAADDKKSVAPKERPVASYADARTKTVTLPNDLATAFQQAPDEKKFFESCRLPTKKNTWNGWFLPSGKKQESRE
jgi:hypothetical protein